MHTPATIQVGVLAAEGGRRTVRGVAAGARAALGEAARAAPGAHGAGAGPGGFALQRQLEAAGIECQVVAPANSASRS